jgi:hypothetical protein
MGNYELDTKNFSRIFRLNWLIAGPVLLLFAWPYLLVCQHFGVDRLLNLVGAFFFSMPFCLTIVSGHIAVAVGPLHFQRYFEWQQNLPGILKFAFHPVLFKTEYRLSAFAISLLILVISIS